MCIRVYNRSDTAETEMKLKIVHTAMTIGTRDSALMTGSVVTTSAKLDMVPFVRCS